MLTRGKRWDKVFPPHWPAPIHHTAKDELLRKKVDLLVRALHLEDLLARNKEAAAADRYGPVRTASPLSLDPG